VIKKRNRSKPATPFEARLAKFADNLRRNVKAATPGSAEALELRNRLRKSEHALDISASLMAPERERTR
jgi:hypothetical protein